MKNLILLFLFPFLLTGTTYHIKKGSNYCQESGFINLGTVQGIDFTVTLDSTILIDMGSTEANNAAQKLFGVSFGTDNHYNSWRLTYSIASIANKKIFLRNYMYNHSVRLNNKFGANNQKVTLVNGYASFDGRVRFNYEANKIYLAIPKYNIDTTFTFDFRGANKTCYQQFFYFEPSAPWNMTCTIQQSYLR